MNRIITFAEAVREALDQSMAADENIIVFMGAGSITNFAHELVS